MELLRDDYIVFAASDQIEEYSVDLGVSCLPVDLEFRQRACNVAIRKYLVGSEFLRKHCLLQVRGMIQ